MDYKDWDMLAFKTYVLIYFNDLSSFQTKTQVNSICDIVGSYMYLVQSKCYYKDTSRAARFKIKHYISKNNISKDELDELFADMKKVIQVSNYFGKRQKQFLEFFDDVSKKYDINVDQLFL